LYLGRLLVRSRHPHHSRGYPVGFLLKHVARLADLQLRLHDMVAKRPLALEQD
jgi:hypothetical protein